LSIPIASTENQSLLAQVLAFPPSTHSSKLWGEAAAIAGEKSVVKFRSLKGDDWRLWSDEIKGKGN